MTSTKPKPRPVFISPETRAIMAATICAGERIRDCASGSVANAVLVTDALLESLGYEVKT